MTAAAGRGAATSGRAAHAAAVAALRGRITPQRWEKLASAVTQRCGRVHLAFEQCFKNDNVAAALRTAECLGVANVHLIRSEQEQRWRTDRKRVNSSVSKAAERWLDIHYHASTADFLERLRPAGVYAADADPRATPIAATPPLNTPLPPLTPGSGGGGWGGAQLCVVFGNERDGVSPELRRDATGLFTLPSAGLTQSFNVSVACAMTLYHLQAQRVLRPDMDEEEQTAVLCRLLLRTVPNGAASLRHAFNVEGGGVLTEEVVAALVAEAGQRPPFPSKTTQPHGELEPERG